jgi:3-oxoacyl-[acyl-carrier protein] reductase
MNARGQDALEEAANGIRARFDVRVQTVAADITTLEGQNSVLDVAGTPDILINNAGGPPPGMWSDWEKKKIFSLHLKPICLLQLH